jgi:hypothetical protein
MRLCATWPFLAHAGCVAGVALSAGCGLSTVGLDGEPRDTDDAGHEVDATSSGEGSAQGGDDATDVTDATNDSHYAPDGPSHHGDAGEGGSPGNDASGDDAESDAGPTDSGNAGDGGDAGDAGRGAGPDGGCSGAADCVTVPSGWTLVAFAPSQTTACPSGFQSPANLVESPDAASACACGSCSVTGQPSCASGSVGVFYDDLTSGGGAGTCSLPAMSPMLDNSPAGGCGTGTDVYHGSYALFDLKYVPPAASGGTCSSPGSATGSVTYAGHDRTCLPVSAQAAGCVGSECAPGLAAPYSACIMQSGSVSCPPGPLSVQHVAGSGVSYGCSACGCSVSATCTGTITLYSDTKCKDPGVQIPADGSCNRIVSLPDSANTYTFEAYEYAANAPTAVGCSPSGASTAQNVALAGPITICCAP